MMMVFIGVPDEEVQVLQLNYMSRAAAADLVHELIEMGEGDIKIVIREEDEDGDII